MSPLSSDCPCKSSSWFKRSVTALPEGVNPVCSCCCTWRMKAAASFRRMLFLCTAASALSACGSIPPLHADGSYLTTQHGTARFRDALKGAQEYCGSRGLGVRHLGTDTPGLSISRFECVGPQ